MAVSSEPQRKPNLMILASSLWIGGAETVMRHLAENIDRDRFNVVVACLKSRGQVADAMVQGGIEVIDIAGSAKTDYLSFRKLLRVVRERKIDVIHSHTNHGLVDAALCRVFSPGLRVVHTFHFGNYPHTRNNNLFMEFVFSRLVDRLIAVGEAQRRLLKKYYRFSDRSIRTLWNGVKLSNSTGDESFRVRVGADGRVLVGVIATLIGQKGLHDFMRVARKVLDAGHNAQFVIVGEGKLRPELEALRHELGLDDRVIMTGWVTNAAEQAMPQFDIFFQPSLWEAMSVVILEAMAAGKAIVATRVGENAGVLEDGVDGMLVNATDVDGMAAVLGRVIADERLRRGLGLAARAKVERQFTVAQMTRAYEEVYLGIDGPVSARRVPEPPRRDIPGEEVRIL